MKKPCLFLLVTALFIALSAQIFSQTTIWQLGPGNLSTGTAPNTGRLVTTFGFPSAPTISSGTASAVSGVGDINFVQVDNGWDGGARNRGWTITVNTQYCNTLKLSFIQASYNRNGADFGPKDFQLQYSTNGTTWTNLIATITLTDPWNSSQLVSEFSLPVACDNQSSLYLRWLMKSNTATDGGSIRGIGASLLGNIIITGTAVPTPPTDILLSNNMIVNTSPTGTVIGTLSALDDGNPLNSHAYTFSLVAGTGSVDNGLFAIVGNELRVNSILTEGLKSIRVNVYDGTYNVAKVFSIDVRQYEYLAINGGDNSMDWITNVTFNQINKTSGQETNGYGNYTSISTLVEPGATYNLYVTNGAGIAFPQNIKAWVDWNQNGSFNDPGESYEVHNDIEIQGTYSKAIQVPIDAAEGTTRMRVVLRSPLDTPPDLSTPNSGLFDYGEAEDYSININSAYPVELSSFTASAAGKNSVVLNWRTAAEVNNYGFEIERKQKHWEKIGFAPGCGYSNSTKEYTFTDDRPLSGKIEYRLKQIDNDGNFKYYDAVTVSVDAPAEYKLLQNSPNPFNPSTAIKFQLPVNSLVSVKVYDLIGCEVATLVNEEKPAGSHIVYWNGRNNDGLTVASGVYLYKLNAGSYSQTRKMNFIK